VPPVDETAGTIERMLAIKTQPMFADMHPDELAIIAEHLQVHTFRRGETIFSGTESPVACIHLVLEGRVTEFRGGRAFRSHGPQQVVGAVDALALAATDVAAVAEEDTTTFAIERAALREVLEDNFGVLSVALRGVAAATLHLRRQLVPSAGFAACVKDTDEAPVVLQELGARIAFLRGHPWLRHARIETLGQLAQEANFVSLPDRERLWAEGDPADHAVLVVQGLVVCATTDDRQRFEGGRRAIFGLEEALAVEARWYGAMTRGPVALVRITRTAIVDALEDDPDTALEALAAIARIASLLRDHVARDAGRPDQQTISTV
jgi:CRP-like cAMP-binding protein